MKGFWKYLDEHHEEYGAGLFIVPALLCGFAMVGAVRFLAWLF